MTVPVIERICPHCEKHFELVTKNGIYQRIHCSRSCAAKSTLSSRVGAQEWKKEEDVFLLSLVGKYQRLQIIEMWNDIATENGWPTRTEESVKIHYDRLCQKFKISRKSPTDNWTLRELARRLDIPPDRVERWIELGLKYKTVGKFSRLMSISRKNFKAFAVAQPGQMWGIELNKLRQTLGDRQLAKEIYAVAEQPTVGRAIVVVRLDKAEVYRSARNAACTLKPEGWQGMKASILKTCKKDTPMRNGMDFVQLDYPVFWVPMACREEFNQIAGKLLFEIHSELKPLPGYRKTTCTIVSARLAVQITLIIFRRRLKDANEGNQSWDVDSLSEFWKKFFLAKIKKYATINSSRAFPALFSIVRNHAYNFKELILSKETNKIQLFLDDFVSTFIEESMQYYYKTSYLPRYYQPTDRIGIADLYAFIEGAFRIKIKLGDKTTRLGFVKLLRYCKKMLAPFEENYDLSGTGSNLETAIATNQDSTHLLDKFVEYISTAKGINSSEKEKCELFIALKLEDASDNQIATTLGVSMLQLREIESKIQMLAKRYAQENEVV